MTTLVTRDMSRNRTRDEEGLPNPTDLHVGRRLRLRRTMLGMSQEKLSEAVGLTFQQIQKYERGTNRIGASRLCQFSQLLGVPIGFFFDDMDAPLTSDTGLGEEPSAYGKPPAPAAEEPPSGALSRDMVELLRLYNAIEDPDVRKQVLSLVRTVVRSVVQSDK